MYFLFYSWSLRCISCLLMRGIKWMSSVDYPNLEFWRSCRNFTRLIFTTRLDGLQIRYSVTFFALDLQKPRKTTVHFSAHLRFFALIQNSNVIRSPYHTYVGALNQLGLETERNLINNELKCSNLYNITEHYRTFQKSRTFLRFDFPVEVVLTNNYCIIESHFSCRSIQSC